MKYEGAIRRVERDKARSYWEIVCKRLKPEMEFERGVKEGQKRKEPLKKGTTLNDMLMNGQLEGFWRKNLIWGAVREGCRRLCKYPNTTVDRDIYFTRRM